MCECLSECNCKYLYVFFVEINWHNILIDECFINSNRYKSHDCHFGHDMAKNMNPMSKIWLSCCVAQDIFILKVKLPSQADIRQFT